MRDRPDRAPRFFTLFFSLFPARRVARVAPCRGQSPLRLRGTGNAYRRDDGGEKATSRSAIASSTRLLRGLDASGIMLPSRRRTGTTSEDGILIGVISAFD